MVMHVQILLFCDLIVSCLLFDFVCLTLSVSILVSIFGTATKCININYKIKFSPILHLDAGQLTETIQPSQWHSQ